jgi:murein DD-endopeptidase MepM/ murein hydrolase activator NlpD
MSSTYGYRSDPFNGRRSFHGGMDFAGAAGTDVLAVASGVVIWSGERHGYGHLIEIDHGNGLTTRYGHNQKNLVAVGETVKKGQPIALMGSTGRSTAPHVHLEVLQDGRRLNPGQYVR